MTNVVMSKHKKSMLGKVNSKFIIGLPHVCTQAMGNKQKSPVLSIKIFYHSQ